MNNPIKILLADDHQILLEGLEVILKRMPEYEIIGKASDGEEVMKILEDQDADVIVLDINMPKKDGIDVLKELTQLNHDAKKIMLSSFSDLKLVNESIRNGADAYLTKKCARKEIVEAIKTVLAGEMYYGETIREKIVHNFQNPTAKKKTNEDGEEGLVRLLSKRELEVLRLIALEYSSKEIAEQLFVSQSTIDTHRKSLIAKLNVKNSIGLVKFAIKNKII